MRRSVRWLAPFAGLLWCLAPLTSAAKYKDTDGWGRAAECVNWNEDELIVGGLQPVDDFQEIIPDRLYPAIFKKLDPAWRKCCVPSFNLLNACYKASVPCGAGGAWARGASRGPPQAPCCWLLHPWYCFWGSTCVVWQ